MTEYDNTNAGVLFKNDRRENDRQPTHTGSVCTECPNCGTKTDYWQSAWVKEGKRGKFFSQAFKPKDAPQQAAPVPAAPAGEPFSDDVPF